MRRVYMDNGATSYPKAPGVGEAMADYILNVGCNIGRGDYAAAYDAASLALETREQVKRLVNGPGARNVIFTPGSTHSLNYLIKGLLRPGDRVVTSPMEHNGVLRPLTQLQAEGVEVDFLPCNDKGELLLEEVPAHLTPGTRAVVLTHASNVCGTILPIGAVGKLCRERGIRFLVDASQTAGAVPIDMEEMGIDGLAFPGHKALLGPQGIGLMVVTDALAGELTPLVAGGTGSVSHELTMPSFLPDRLEAGTLNLPGIMGLRAALLWLKETGMDRIRRHELHLTDQMLHGLQPLESRGVFPVGIRSTHNRVGVVSLRFDGRDPAELAARLDSEYGISTRVGLHCAPSAHQTLGTFPTGTIRFSFGWWNTEQDVDAALKALDALTR